jgi:hypothetical protein
MDARTVLAEVEAAFAPVEMPASNDLVPESPRYIESEQIRRDLDELRDSPVDDKVIRTIHRYLPVLSAKTTRWILPHFLRFCLAEAGQKFSRVETASLIYALSPNSSFEANTIERMALLSGDQILTLIHFLEWCASDSYWLDSEPERVGEGIAFLKRVLSTNGKGDRVC